MAEEKAPSRHMHPADEVLGLNEAIDARTDLAFPVIEVSEAIMATNVKQRREPDAVLPAGLYAFRLEMSSDSYMTLGLSAQLDSSMSYEKYSVLFMPTGLYERATSAIGATSLSMTHQKGESSLSGLLFAYEDLNFVGSKRANLRLEITGTGTDEKLVEYRMRFTKLS